MVEEEQIDCTEDCAVTIEDDVLNAVDTESTSDVINALIEQRLADLERVRAMIDAGEVKDMVFHVTDAPTMLELLNELENDILTGEYVVKYEVNSTRFSGRSVIQDGVLMISREI